MLDFLLFKNLFFTFIIDVESRTVPVGHHTVQSFLHEVKAFHVLVEIDLHLFICGNEVVGAVFVLFFVLVDYFELDFVQALSVVYDAFVGLVKF
jgi:hypothetical protein